MILPSWWYIPHVCLEFLGCLTTKQCHRLSSSVKEVQSHFDALWLFPTAHASLNGFICFYLTSNGLNVFCVAPFGALDAMAERRHIKNIVIVMMMSSSTGGEIVK